MHYYFRRPETKKEFIGEKAQYYHSDGCAGMYAAGQ